MKRILALLLALVMVLAFCSCGSGKNGDQESQEPVVNLPDTGKKAPSEDLIMADIGNALLGKNQYATLTGVETVKSLTNEGSYEITLNVTAETKYADWTYEADLSYTEYDQGWILDDVDWVSESYVQVRTPNADVMVEYASQYLLEHEVYSDVWFSDYMVPMSDAVVNYGGIDQSGEYVLDFEWNAYEPLKHGETLHWFASRWYYDAEKDNWELYPDNSTGSLGYMLEDHYLLAYPNKNLDFSGTWTIDTAPSPEYTIEIANFTWESFDLTISTLGIVNEHLYHVDVPSDMGYADYAFTNGEERYIIFKFKESETEVYLWHDAGYGLGNYGYYVSIMGTLPELGN